MGRQHPALVKSLTAKAMSSGTYFPPPVRAVEIPKASGGTRVLGVPTEPANRPVAQGS
jgi:retron-type reverse transcriptase